MFLGMMLGTDAHHMTGTCIRALWSSTLLQDSCCLTMGFIVGVLNVYNIRSAHRYRRNPAKNPSQADLVDCDANGLQCTGAFGP